MPTKNSIFNFEDQNTNEANADNVVNLRKRKVSRLYTSDGRYHEFVQADTISMPDGNGGWIDAELSADYVDDMGNPIPKDMNGVTLSYTGRLIPPGRMAVCNSAFHPQTMTRNMYLDIDGSIIGNDPICSICQQRKFFFTVISAFVGIGVVVGVFMGFGWF